MATTYWQNNHPQALILPTKEGTSITIPQAGYVRDESGTYYSASFGLTSIADPGVVTFAYAYPADPVDVSGVTFVGNILSRNYVDNAAALADGLVEGQLYHTDGALKVVIPAE